MYDFWYTLGAAAIDPKLLAAITAPKFVFGQRLIIERVDTTPTLRTAHNTGQLDNQATTAARSQIAMFFAGKKAAFPAVPPIGIYTAGRFCQLMKIPQFDGNDKQSTFARIIKNANTAYKSAVTATHNPGQSPMIPAFLGLLLMDQKFVDAFDDQPAAQVDPSVKEIFGEFGIQVADGGPDFELAKAFVDSPEFDDAVGDLMGGKLDPWSDGGTTLEQVLFWGGKSEFAIT